VINTTAARVRATLPLALITALLVLSQSGPRAASEAGEVRALWVTRGSLVSAESVSDMIRSAAATGFNTLLVQVRGRGDAYFASRVEPRAEALAGQPATFDPLAATLALARAHGLRVHAWVNVNLTSSGAELPASREHVIYEHPEWLMVPRGLAFELGRTDPRSPEYLGRLARWTRSVPTEVEGLYSSPVHQGAVDRLAAVIDELVSNYALDGLHLDYARYPSAAFDYSRGAMGAFRAQIDSELTAAERLRYGTRDTAELLGVTELKPERWAEFRRSRLNALVMRVRTVAKARRPGIVLSAAVYPDSSEAASGRLQDWRGWLEQRLIDVVCPMAYTPDTTAFAAQIASVRQLAGDQPVWAGIGAYRLSSSQTIENIRTARRLGAEGVVLFSYDSLVRAPHGADYLPAVARAAFRP
jgi:uncharacterized lipoprotein YddW (UPF0748 family)